MEMLATLPVHITIACPLGLECHQALILLTIGLLAKNKQNTPS
jgi:hypothetical protein